MQSRIASKTYGTVSADRQKEMSGLEFVQGLVDGTLPLNTIAETLGYDVTEAVSGGGFNRSSQHSRFGGCDEHSKEATNTDRTSATAIAGTAVCCRAR